MSCVGSSPTGGIEKHKTKKNEYYDYGYFS